MIEKKVDIWEAHADGGVVCITTNGYVKSDGKAVMGRGVAKGALTLYSDIDAILGEKISWTGNVVQYIRPRILAFPVKPAFGVAQRGMRNIVRHMRGCSSPGRVMPGWAMKADTEIIKRSLYELYLHRQLEWVPLHPPVYLPRPGCGAGELDWETEVKPLCEQYGDWLVVVHI